MSTREIQCFYLSAKRHAVNSDNITRIALLVFRSDWNSKESSYQLYTNLIIWYVPLTLYQNHIWYPMDVSHFKNITVAISRRESQFYVISPLCKYLSHQLLKFSKRKTIYNFLAKTRSDVNACLAHLIFNFLLLIWHNIMVIKINHNFQRSSNRAAYAVFIDIVQGTGQTFICFDGKRILLLQRLQLHPPK